MKNNKIKITAIITLILQMFIFKGLGFSLSLQSELQRDGKKELKKLYELENYFLDCVICKKKCIKEMRLSCGHGFCQGCQTQLRRVLLCKPPR